MAVDGTEQARAFARTPEKRHQGLPVAGYQAQSAEKVALVNEHKLMEERLLRRIDALLREGHADIHWAEAARCRFEEGFMALNRAVFQPRRIALPEDARPQAPAVPRRLDEGDGASGPAGGLPPGRYHP